MSGAQDRRVPRPLARLRTRLPVAAVALLLAVAGCSSAPAPSTSGDGAPPASPAPDSSATSAAPGGLSWSPCERGFTCAGLTVPLGAEAGSTVLAVTRRAASRDRIGVLVVNPGGPGASAVDFLQQSAGQLPRDVRERFDLVAVDPRGVGRSSPVRCGTTSDLDRFWALDPSPDSPQEQAAYERGAAELVAGCADRAGALLPHVSTADAAADLDRLREALGEPTLSYLGYSYGTSIGAAYADAFPTRVRAMVLDGAVDPALTWDALLAGQSRGFDAALAAMLADCERTRCAFRRAVSGPLPQAYDALEARVDAAPLPTTGSRVLGPGEFTLGVGAGLYDREQGWPAVAAALATAQRGDGRALLALSDAYLERDESGYAPTSESNLAVSCLDRPWPRALQPYLDLAARLEQEAPRFGPAIALSALPCATWPAPPVSTPRPVRAEGAPPVVVVGTTGDPATPYAWSVALAGQLASGVLLTSTGEGHTVYRAGGPACVVGAVDTYLLTGQAPGALRC